MAVFDEAVKTSVVIPIFLFDKNFTELRVREFFDQDREPFDVVPGSLQ